WVVTLEDLEIGHGQAEVDEHARRAAGTQDRDPDARRGVAVEVRRRRGRVGEETVVRAAGKRIAGVAAVARVRRTVDVAGAVGLLELDQPVQGRGLGVFLVAGLRFVNVPGQDP